MGFHERTGGFPSGYLTFWKNLETYSQYENQVCRSMDIYLSIRTGHLNYFILTVVINSGTRLFLFYINLMAFLKW